MLKIPAAILDRVRSYAAAAFPEECCGILLGETGGESREVISAIPCDNAHPAPRTHYGIAPADLVSAQRHARASGQQIVGFYHSHPRHPALPSPADQADAFWQGCSYLIISVSPQGAAEVDSFCCVAKQKLIPEKLELI